MDKKFHPEDQRGPEKRDFQAVSPHEKRSEEQNGFLLEANELHLNIFNPIDLCSAVKMFDLNGFPFRAALGGHAYICQTLVKFGIDPNIKDHSG